METEQAEEFEQKYVHEFYSSKAGEFAGTRWKPWPYTLHFFDRYVAESALVLDGGCGNGRQFLRPNTIGLDYSVELLNKAALNNPLSLIRSDICMLPFCDSIFDTVISIAVIHHLATEQRRERAMKEMKRVLKVGGYGLIYLWHETAGKQKKFKEIKQGEYLVSWRGIERETRYYKLFNEEELEILCKQVGFTIIELRREQESVLAVIKKE